MFCTSRKGEASKEISILRQKRERLLERIEPGKAGVTEQRVLLKIATHDLMAAELKGR